MKSISELTKDLGPLRKRELIEANDTLQAAKAKLTELQQSLAKQRESQAALAPTTVVTAGVNMATLAQGLQLQSAHDAVISHLEKEIPLAQRAVDNAGLAWSRVREAIGRKYEDIAGQEKVKAEAQAKIDKANAWLDS